MPFDPIPYDAPVQDLSYATGDEGLLRLAALLEHEDLWRNHAMTWNFTELYTDSRGMCGTAGCAIGLARAMWPEFAAELPSSIDHMSILGHRDVLAIWNRVSEVFRIAHKDSDAIFGGGLADRLGKGMNEVTPGDVAAGIREFVFKRSGRTG